MRAGGAKDSGGNDGQDASGHDVGLEYKNCKCKYKDEKNPSKENIVCNCDIDVKPYKEKTKPASKYMYNQTDIK